MPGAYPEYPDTPQGRATYDFWMNYRFGALTIIPMAVVSISYAREYFGLTGSFVAALACAVWFGCVLYFNLGGRLFARFGPGARGQNKQGQEKTEVTSRDR